MEERENTIAWLVLWALILSAVGYYMYSYSQAVDRFMDEHYEEIRSRHQGTTLGMTEQEELELLLVPLLIDDEPATPAYVDREVQDWIDDHPFYEWGEVV